MSKIDVEAKKLAEKYTPINLDDASPTFIQAFQLFQKGMLDSAQTILSTAALSNQVDLSLLEDQRIKSVEKNLYNEKVIAKKQKDAIGQSFSLKADLHTAKHEIDSVFYCYDQLMRLDSLNHRYIFDYAFFLNSQNQYEKAKTLYLKLFEIYKIEGRTNPLLYEAFAGDVHTNLGNLYVTMRDFSKAENEFNQALIIYQKHTKINPQFFGLYVAHVQTDLGQLFYRAGDLDKAETNFLNSLAVITQYYNRDTISYKPDIAVINNALGNLYRSKKIFSKAKAFFENSLKYYQDLLKSDSILYESYLAYVKVNLSRLYMDMNDFISAENILMEALTTTEKQVKLNPQNFEPDYANALSLLGTLYARKGDFTKSFKSYRQAIQIYGRAVLHDPQVYEPFLANDYTNIANAYLQSNNLPEAKASFTNALKIYLRLNVEGGFEQNIARIKSRMGSIYSIENNFLEAEFSFRESVQIFSAMKKKQHTPPNIELATVLLNLGQLYKAEDLLYEAESNYLQALTIREDQKRIEGDVANKDIALLKYYLGNLYIRLNNRPRAEIFYLDAMRLSKADPASDSSHVTFLSRILNNLGALYFELGRYTESEKLLIESLKLRTKAVRFSKIDLKDAVLTASTLLTLYSNVMDSLKDKSFQKSSANNFESVAHNLFEVALEDSIFRKRLSNIYERRAWYLIFAHRFREAEISARTGLKIDSSLTLLKTKIAHTLFFQGKVNDAYKLYGELKQLNSKDRSFGNICLDELSELATKGVTCKGEDKILEFLRQ